MSVIVVGSAPIKNQGELIDSYDTVIRLNYFFHSPNHKDRGSKVDIWSSQFPHVLKINETMCKYKIPTMWMFKVIGGNIAVPEIIKINEMVRGDPTTGFYATMYAIKKFGSCDVIGFTFFEGDRIHFYDKKGGPPALGTHNPKQEKAIFQAHPNITIKENE